MQLQSNKGILLITGAQGWVKQLLENWLQE